VSYLKANNVYTTNHRRNLGGARGQMPPPQYFFNLGIVFLVIEFNNGEQKIKKENEKFALYGTNFALFQI
jgi:hypothetical protein